MKLHVLSAWALFALVGSFFAVSPTQAQHVTNFSTGLSRAALSTPAISIPPLAGPWRPGGSPTPGQAVYSDALQNGWQNWSWATLDCANATPTHTGSASLSISAGPWQALYLHHDAFDTTPYTCLKFWIHGGSVGGQKLQVQAMLNGQPQTPVVLAPLAANVWQPVKIRLPDLGVYGKQNMDGFCIQDATGTTQPTFYVDDVSLVGFPPLPGIPAGVTAQGGNSLVSLHWAAAPGGWEYNLRRSATSGSGYLPLGWTKQTSYTDSTAVNGTTYYYVVTAVNATAESAISGEAGATPQGAMLLAPSGLTAAGLWVSNCPVCKMPMAHIALNWNPVQGAASYTVYRNGAALQTSVTTNSLTDMAVASGQSYTYTVAAVCPTCASPQSASVSASAPMPPAPPGAPTNLAVQGSLQSGAGSDILSWSPVPGAASYNIYQYDLPIGSATTSTFAVPFSLFNGALTYTVTAVNAAGVESLPSAQAGALGAFSSSTVPNWVSSAAPAVPQSLSATPDWNSGLPRIRVAWQGSGAAQSYNVYRDGSLVAQGIWTLGYMDNAVQPGETHTYTVSSINAYWPGTVESAQSISITAQALNAAPLPLGTKIAITKVVPNDDSCVVFFNEVPGAVDYCIYDVHNPGKVKYAGLRVSKTNGLASAFTPQPYCIEWNGINPALGADLVVEAVDKLGPFQKMDGAVGPGAMNMDGTMSDCINGQGDPSNVPNVLAASDPFHVACQPMTLAGSQVFSDNFRTENPFTALPMPARDPRGPFYGLPGDYKEQGNDKWTLKYFGADLVNSQSFVMGNHFMDTLYDGGGPGSSESPHNNNASLALMPQATEDISGGKVLHVTFEVDAHFDTRRWCDVFVAPAGDLLLNPAKFDQADGGNNIATASTQMLRWVVKQAHDLSLYNGGVKTDLVQAADWNDGQTLNRLRWDGAAQANGSTQDLDKRHRFDLYLSQAHYRIVETTPDGLYNITWDKDFPAGASLPFSQCQVYFVHEVYHTANDRPETIDYAPYDSYWANYRPYADERHWDNFGIEVLPAFPQ